MSRNACNGETGEKSPASSDLNWMPKVAPWRLAILAKIFVYILAIKRQFCHFRQNRHFPKGLCHLICIFVYSLVILAIKRQFCHFRQICHFRQNRHFSKGPFDISFEFLFTVWRLSANSAIFTKYTIFANIATFQRAPLPSHLNVCLQFGDFGN